MHIYAGVKLFKATFLGKEDVLPVPVEGLKHEIYMRVS